MAGLAGGISGVKPIDDTTKELAFEFRQAVEQAHGSAFTTFEPVYFRSQVCLNK